MYKPESILENETPKIPRAFEIQMDHSILARRPDLVLINKKEKNLLSSGFFHSSRQYSKNKRKKKDRQILESCQQTGKAVEHEDNSDTSCSWSPLNCSQRPRKETRGSGDQRKNQDNPDHSTVKINKSTKSSADLRGLTITQTSVKNPISIISTDSLQRDFFFFF